MINKDNDKDQRHGCDPWDNDEYFDNLDCDNHSGHGGCGGNFKCCFNPNLINNINESICGLKDQLDECEGILRFTPLASLLGKFAVNLGGLKNDQPLNKGKIVEG